MYGYFLDPTGGTGSPLTDSQFQDDKLMVSLWKLHGEYMQTRRVTVEQSEAIHAICLSVCFLCEVTKKTSNSGVKTSSRGTIAWRGYKLKDGVIWN